ncbi:SDR family oxidoreductase [Actinomadura sp. DC4]|uniref:SDR family oxidoreductase n=1 Tax=Actinomadura sp. DC4 TaxID=3055069 RepID=UPI0025AFB74A|nr:SDR family oxidoreductase [Actinomadura sp. DC4]MDN3357570.1 SDR family oxidoreductase [Actinomadura sp. DC4]
MSDRTLAGCRVLVVGASAGIGRAMAIRAVKEGADVLMAARRADRLEEACAEAGGGHAVPADIRADADCDRLMEAVRDRLGRIDVLVSCVGVAPMRLLADTTAADWHRVFDTNVVATHRLLRACLPSLAPRAMVLCLSSESVRQPRTALAAYATSKAALERLIEGWRAEHPELRLTRVTVGATFPTEFGDGFEAGLLTRALNDWSARGLAQAEFMAPEEVADVLNGVIAAACRYPGVCVDDLTVRSPSPVVGTFGGAIDEALND